jgi:hypothetical protein
MAKVKVTKSTSGEIAAFISHNKRDKDSARSLAMALVEQGADVWFDEWKLRPGDSLVGGIERGLAEANVFVLIWSKHAAKSKWVGTEVRAYLRRRVDDGTLRIVPVMLDNTPLPVLVADYFGFAKADATNMVHVAAKICGQQDDRELARRLQDRFLELTDGISTGGDPLPYRVCPRCGSGNLERFQVTDYARDDQYYCIRCKECRWEDGTEI